MKITADFLWKIHRAALGGKSSATGAELPERLEHCPPGARAAHWALAFAVSVASETPAPPLPDGVSEEEAERVRERVIAALARIERERSSGDSASQ